MQPIAHWLNALGLGQYAQRFADNDIDASILRDLTDEDLEKIGVSLGHRKKILRAIAELDEVGIAPESPRWDEAERRQLTVMFADLVGSTALSTRLDPEDLRKIIGAYQRRCAEVIAKSGGFVARYLGDGILAYFGYPQAHEEDAERAVRAGLELIEAVAKLDDGAGTALHMRVGVATGLVVVGDLRSEGAGQEHEVVGETPNLAARLQALAEPDTVVISGSTRRLLGELFENRALGTVSVKGFGAPVPVWQVTGASAVDSRFEALRRGSGETPLVGREEEIELLLRRWQQAKRGDGCVVLISGEAGIGKSRIAQTVLTRLSSEPHIRLRYFCSPHHQDSALYPTISRLERAAGFRRADTTEERLDKLEALLAQATNDVSEAAPLIADLLSIPTGGRYPALDLTPQRRKEKTFEAMIAQVEGLAARQPVLMLFDDVHWSDPTTREFLDLLIDRVPTLRVLVIITFRPEFTPPWVGPSHVTLLSLSRLAPRQSAEMMMRVTGGKVLPREIADQIIDRTDGVPLFIEELTKSVVESGLVTEDGDRYAVTGPMASLAIPMTLQASLLARLDRLASVRDVAQIGAALGRQFSHELISAIAQQQQLDDALQQLVHAELISRRGIPPDAEYTFKHALVQEAAYSTLLRGQRQHLHARITTTLEERFPEIVTSQPGLLARHCAEGGMAEKAIAYCLAAGEQAITRSAMAEAVAQLRRGLNLLTSLSDTAGRGRHELNLQIALGRALIATKGQGARATGEAYARARQLCEQLERPAQLLPVLFGQWMHYLLRAELILARRSAAELQQLGKAQDDTSLKFVACRWGGVTDLYLGEFTAARAELEHGLALFDPVQRPFYAALEVYDAHVAILSYLSRILVSLGYFDQARTRRDAALAEAGKLGHTFTLAHALFLACLDEWSVKSERALFRHAEELATLSAEHDFALFSAGGSLFRGWCIVALSQGQQGIELLDEALAAWRATGSMLLVPFFLLLLADANGKAGQPEHGLRRLDEVARLLETTQERWVEAEMHRLRGELLAATGNRAAAEETFRHALNVARHQSAKLWELRAATSLARLWRDQGKRTQARNLLAPIYGWFKEGFDTPVLKEAKTLLEQFTE